ncbi:hypothetical protein [Candidatus Amarobacter glycogenicus]|nr:hypothetical protein [Dehalococcoidia bacterium]
MSAIQNWGWSFRSRHRRHRLRRHPMAEHSHPPLTTVHQPIYRIGKMMV